MNGGVNLTVKVFKRFSLWYLRMQNGSIQRYNAYAFIIITVVLICLIFGYMAMLM